MLGNPNGAEINPMYGASDTPQAVRGGSNSCEVRAMGGSPLEPRAI